MSNLTDPASRHDATNPNAHARSSAEDACDSCRSMPRQCSCQTLNAAADLHTPTSRPLYGLLLLDKLTILMPHLISLIQILVFVWVATFVLPLIQPFFSPVFKAVTTIANLPQVTLRFCVSSVSGFYDSTSTAMYGASRNMGMSLVNVTTSWLTWTSVNSTQALPISPSPPIREEVVYAFLSGAANSTQNFFDMFYELCNARGLERFLRETILIFDKARQVGRESQIPNCREVVDSILTVYNSFTNVYHVLVHVRWAGLGFLEGYIGWLLYLQDRIEQLPAEDDEAYLPQWLAFIADIEEEFNTTADDAIAFRHYVEDNIHLVSDARSLAMNVSEDLDGHSKATLKARSPFNYLPDFVYAFCRDNFLILRTHEGDHILLRSATLQIDSAHKSLTLLHMRLEELISLAAEFQTRLRTTEKRTKAIKDPQVILDHFVRVVDSLVRKKDALVTELGSDKRFQLLDDDGSH